MEASHKTHRPHMKVGKDEEKKKTDENKKAYMTELTNSGIYDQLKNHKDANPNDNYDILHNMLSGIGAKCMPTKKLK